MYLAPFRIIVLTLCVMFCAIVSGRAEAAVPAPGSSFQDCANCPTLVVVPPGEFKMGSTEGESDRPETPVHVVQIDYNFAVGKYAVTNAEYAAFVAATQYPTSQGCNYVGAGGYGHSLTNSWRDPGYGRPPADNEPVVCVQWLDAKAYVAWLSKTTHHHYRLLSEAEWEYAARGGATTRFPWGDTADDICKYANSYDQLAVDLKMPYPTAKCSDGFAGVAPVGSFPPNQFGLYDMLGNVWQWVEDCYMYQYPAWPADGKAVEVYSACPLRSIRGGSWATKSDRLRPAWRGRDAETMMNKIFGFRVARDL